MIAAANMPPPKACRTAAGFSVIGGLREARESLRLVIARTVVSSVRNHWRDRMLLLLPSLLAFAFFSFFPCFGSISENLVRNVFHCRQVVRVLYRVDQMGEYSLVRPFEHSSFLISQSADCEQCSSCSESPAAIDI
jgi:hypothetical protein